MTTSNGNAAEAGHKALRCRSQVWCAEPGSVYLPPVRSHSFRQVLPHRARPDAQRPTDLPVGLPRRPECPRCVEALGGHDGRATAHRWHLGDTWLRPTISHISPITKPLSSLVS